MREADTLPLSAHRIDAVEVVFRLARRLR